MQVQQKLEPFARIQRAGFDIRFKQNPDHTWTICLMRDGVAVACAQCARNSRYSLAEAEARSRAAEWSTGAPAITALEQLADTAEQTLLDPKAYAAMCERLRAVAVAGRAIKGSAL